MLSPNNLKQNERVTKREESEDREGTGTGESEGTGTGESEGTEEREKGGDRDRG